jgi:hypothetical protein
MLGRLRCSVVVLLTLFVVIAPRQASSHSSPTLYNAWWSASNYDEVRIYNRDNLSGAWLTRALSAAQNWTDVADNGAFTFEYIGVNNEFSRDCRLNSTNRNPIFFATWDGAGDTAARTRQCWNETSDLMTGYSILFDVDEPWTPDAGTPDGACSPPSTPCELDFASVAVHEFGHATGIGAGSADQKEHWDESGEQCPSDDSNPDKRRHTMCPTAPLETTMMRSLELHDEHTVANRY